MIGYCRAYETPLMELGIYLEYVYLTATGYVAAHARASEDAFPDYNP